MVLSWRQREKRSKDTIEGLIWAAKKDANKYANKVATKIDCDILSIRQTHPLEETYNKGCCNVRRDTLVTRSEVAVSSHGNAYRCKRSPPRPCLARHVVGSRCEPLTMHRSCRGSVEESR